MPKNSIYVQTQTKETANRDKNITSKQWKIYYYLLSESKFNSTIIEDHRYVYKKDFNISACCRFLGVKSNQTFYNAIEALNKKGLVKDMGRYYFLYSKTPIDINKNVLNNLISYSTGKEKESKIDLLRTYLILKKMDKLAENQDERRFTKRQLIMLLGHNTTTQSYYEELVIFLALLSFWGLISISYYTAYDEKIGKYTVYYLKETRDIPTNPDFETDIKTEMQAPIMSETMVNKLRFSEGELLGNIL